jgi:hypothetical protein
MRARATALAGLALALASSPGCGYALIGQGSILPEHVKVVVVVPFANQTSRPEIEQRVTEAVTREMSRRGKYDVVTDANTADAMLEGAISAYRTVPVQFSPDGLATRVEAIVTIQATLRDLTNEEILWNQDGLVFRQQFEVEEGEEFFDQETLALELIARGAASALVTSILEGF